MTPLLWHEEVLKRKDDFLKELKHLLSIESVLDESTASVSAPFGKKIAEALDYMLELGKKDGFQTKNVDGYAGHIEYGDGEDIIGVLSHIDVVPPGDGWTTPPFSPVIRDGKLFARGALDDKGPTMAAYFALKIVKELGLPLKKRVRLIVGGDEESRWRCMAHYFEKETMPLMGFSPDADFPIISAEKGFFDIKAVAFNHAKEAPAHGWSLVRFKSGKRVNMVPDYAEVKLGGEGDVFELKERVQDYLLTHQIRGYAEEENDGVTIVMEGKAHHGMDPDKGVNAALSMARFLGEIPLDPEGSAYIGMINDLLTDSFFGEKLGIAMEDEFMGRLTVNAGVFDYEQNGKRLVRLNIRYPKGGDGDEILQAVEKKLSRYHMKIVDVDHKPIHYVDQDHTLIKTLSRVYEEQTGEKAELLAIGGGTYARVLDTGVAFGPLFPGSVETAHQRDEFIVVDELFKATAIYAQAIYELAK
ncbi:MAG: dipeptidase PepV [Thermoactinomyces sp.]